MFKSLGWPQIPPQELGFLQSRKEHELQAEELAAQEWGWTVSPAGTVWGQPPSFPHGNWDASSQAG